MVKPKRAVIIGVVVLLFLSLLIGQRVYSNIASNNERAQRVSRGQQIAVDIASVERRTITPILSYSANIEPRWSANISAKVDGRIKELYLDEGDLVAPGAVIATLDTEELAAQVVQAEGTLFQAKAGMAQAEYNLRRSEQLFKIGAVSEQDADNARTHHRISSGVLRAAQGNLDLLEIKLSNATIVSPQGGVVTKRYLQSGYYVKAGESIVTIADISSLLAKATVGEAQIAQIAIGNEVKVVVNALNKKDFAGKVTRISPSAQMPSRTFIAEVSVSDDEGVLRAGMSATVLAASKEKPNVIAIPETALVMREDMKTAYVVKDGKVQQRKLTVGYVGGGWAEVLDGLSDGDRVVVSGQNKLRDGATVRQQSPGEGDGK